LDRSAQQPGITMAEQNKSSELSDWIKKHVARYLGRAVFPLIEGSRSPRMTGITTTHNSAQLTPAQFPQPRCPHWALRLSPMSMATKRILAFWCNENQVKPLGVGSNKAFNVVA